MRGAAAVTWRNLADCGFRSLTSGDAQYPVRKSGLLHWRATPGRRRGIADHAAVRIDAARFAALRAMADARSLGGRGRRPGSAVTRVAFTGCPERSVVCAR